ncbi:MAG TPA: CBS domain-containing protein [Candidatus Fimadaptatus faecigallinarum]|uniref:CBS domain-containing protein n=1 Tax=Candidatus Fimadaptatus faecigallinarum TaxID=2840814 RepID=A0A9D1S4W3_9FIRM|nr:CBS domain-containing protein [Candidatus Fimadaptatus faecigallinarum]
MVSDEFLERYRVLEDLLSERYGGAPRRHASVIMEFADSKEGEIFRDRLDLCREIRNLLTHNAALNGEPVVTPARATLDMLEDIIAYVRQPPLAANWATSADKLLMTRMSEPVLKLMRIMESRGFSHVPVVERGRITGVFSQSTVFSYIGRANGAKVNDSTRVGDMERYLPLERHSSERFMFMPADVSYVDAAAAFTPGQEREKRLAAIFLTQNGGADEPLIGMITPWDVLGRAKRSIVRPEFGDTGAAVDEQM